MPDKSGEVTTAVASAATAGTEEPNSDAAKIGGGGENGKEDTTAFDQTVWQDALGITAKGNCSRHPNCPVWNAETNTIMSCRICFSEEKSVGIRQRMSFAAVVQQLQTNTSSTDVMATVEEGEPLVTNSTTPSSASTVAVSKTNPATLMLQQPHNFESMLRRLSQVQNWILRRKEKEVMSLQLQISKLEQRLADSETTVTEQKQTIRALRRTIQQDLKLIKTMATQKQMELQAEAEFEAQMLQEQQEQDQLDQEAAAAFSKETHAGMPEMVPLARETSSERRSKATTITDNDTAKVGRSPPRRTVTPFGPGGIRSTTPDRESSSSSTSPSPVQKDPRLNSQLKFFQRANRARGGATGRGGADIGRSRSLNESVHETIPEDSPAPRGDIVLPQALSSSGSGVTGPASSYWSESDMSLANDPSKLFASFRGGLLDIPKSPPAPPTHNTAKHKKIQLNDSDRDALQVPVRGVLIRHHSADATELEPMTAPPPIRKGRKKAKAKIDTGGGNREIPLDLLAQTLTSLPVSRKLQHESPEQFFKEGVHNAKRSSVGAHLPPPPMSSSDSGSYNFKSGPAVPEAPPKRPVRAPSIMKPPALGDLLGSSKELLSDDENTILSADTGPTFAENATLHATVTQQEDKAAQPVGALGKKLNMQPPALKAYTSGDTFATGVSSASFYDDSVATESRGAHPPSEKFLFSVTRAQCRDKYGDVGDYTGTILVTEGLPHGNGTMNYENGRIYSGEWIAGQWNGKGKLLNPNGDTYEGEFVFDARHGKGVYKWDNGDVYTGMFREDKRHGKGKFSFHNGNVYEGEFCDGMFEGFGRYTFDGGYYEGEWKEGRYDGNGELMYASGAKYTGEFRNSVAHGFGMEVTPDGQKRRGLWENGQPVE